VFENGVLGRIFGCEEMKLQEDGENIIMRGFKVCTLHQILLG
jgi:hypothetical protein